MQAMERILASDRSSNALTDKFNRICEEERQNIIANRASLEFDETEQNEDSLTDIKDSFRQASQMIV